MKKEIVIETATNIIKIFNTKDPFVIAAQMGITIDFREYNKNIKGYCYKVFDKLHIIINSNFDKKAQRIICAHELGHAVLHTDYLEPIFSAAFENNGNISAVEYEANLFAATLLLNEKELNTNLSNMSNYLLKGIFDYNF